MVEKLKIKSREEVLKELGASAEGSAFADLFGSMVQPRFPTEKETMDKINELIDHINKLEGHND